MKQITPYFFFAGNCREAMNYYKEVFGGELTMMTIGDAPDPDAEHMPANKELIMHAALTVDGRMVIMASDTMLPDQTVEMGEGVYNAVICTSKDEITTLFTKLSEGSSVNQPLVEAFFGWIGTLTDKFGVKWMLEFDNPK